jgi:NADPH2:quinone reductase
VRAAQVGELRQAPEAVEIAGHGAIEIAAVALNPVDLAVAAGRFYGGHPPLPYVPGCEAVGRLEGDRLYVFGDGRGTVKEGFLAERADIPEALVVPVSDGLDDATAAACGIAGIGLDPGLGESAGSADDRLLVLGATGTVGSLALQAALAFGAEGVGRGRAGCRQA